MINRRKFLKRAGQVLAGGTVLAAKTEPKGLTLEKLLKCKEELEKAEKAQYPLGTRKIMADGRVFRYCQVEKKGFIEQGGQVVGFGTGDGWMQTWGPCIVPTEGQHRIFGYVDVVDENLVYLSINV